MKMNRGQSGNQYNLQDLFKELKDQVHHYSKYLNSLLNFNNLGGNREY